MFSDYRKKVMFAYRKKRANSDLSIELSQPTPKNLRNECLRVYLERPHKKDDKIIRSFFEPKETTTDYSKIIHRCDINKFRPLINYINNRTTDPDDKHIELLAWLIDFELRPHEYGRVYEADEEEPANTEENITVKQLFSGIDTDNNGSSSSSSSSTSTQPESETKELLSNTEITDAPLKEQHTQTDEFTVNLGNITIGDFNSGSVTIGGKITNYDHSGEDSAIDKITGRQISDNSLGEEETPNKDKIKNNTLDLQNTGYEEITDNDQTGNENPGSENSINDDKIKNTGKEGTFPQAGKFWQKLRSYHHLQKAILASAILLGAGSAAADHVPDINENQRCMYWTGDHYRSISCNQTLDNTAIIALDKKKLIGLKKITHPDTLTANSLGKAWYVKVDGEMEFYTAKGYHPLDDNKRLKPITLYILNKYIHRN